MTLVCESAIVTLPHDITNHILSGYPEVCIVASRIHPEFGTEILVEGDRSTVNNLLHELQERMDSYVRGIVSNIHTLEEYEEIPF